MIYRHVLNQGGKGLRTRLTLCELRPHKYNRCFGGQEQCLHQTFGEVDVFETSWGPEFSVFQKKPEGKIKR